MLDRELPSLRSMLEEVGAESFFADYWQQRPVMLSLQRQDFDAILAEIGPLDIGRFCGLAREGARAWLANEFVAHSVISIDASNAERLMGIGATLYFLNIPLERFTNKVADFLGAPRDKVIASLFLTPANGGAVPHFDKNENFTIQLSGSKEWQVGTVPAVAAAPDGHMLGQTVPASLAPLLSVDILPPSQTFSLRPGSLLYIPRGAVHATSSGVESWSLNLSYSPSMWLDLLLIGLRGRLLASERWRRTVTGAGPQSDPSVNRANILPELMAELGGLLADPAEREQVSKIFLQYPNG